MEIKEQIRGPERRQDFQCSGGTGETFTPDIDETIVQLGAQQYQTFEIHVATPESATVQVILLQNFLAVSRERDLLGHNRKVPLQCGTFSTQRTTTTTN